MLNGFWKLACLTAFLCSFAAPSSAQSMQNVAPEPPPLYAMREVGVNMSTSDIAIQNPDISVGTGAFPSRLDLVRSFNVTGMPWKNIQHAKSHNQYNGFGFGSQHNMTAFFTCQACNTGDGTKRIINMSVIVFGRAYHFTGAGPTSTNPNLLQDDNEGATMRVLNPSLAIWTYELITKEGLKVIFSSETGYKYETAGGLFAKYVEFPNGEYIAFRYEISPYLIYPSAPSINGVQRIKYVYNSKGYGFKFNYININPPALYLIPNPSLSDNSIVTSISSFKTNSAFSACMGASPPASCSSNDGTTTLATVQYGYNAFGNDFERAQLLAFTDATGGVKRYTYDALFRLTGVFYPRNTGTTPSIGIAYMTGVKDQESLSVIVAGPGAIAPGDNQSTVMWSVPQSVTDALGNTTSLLFSDPTGPYAVSVTVTRPNGGSRSFSSNFCLYGPYCSLDPYYIRNPTWFKDELGNVRTYTYDSKGRPVSLTNPEGDVLSITRDANGNITETRRKAKPGSGLADIVTSAGYVACTASNRKFCNKPSYVIDAKGARWDYQYNASTGLVAVELAPSNASNLRAVTRFTYTLVPAGIAPVPSGITPSGIYMLTAKDSCLTSTVTGTTINFAYTCAAGSRRRETFQYDPSTYNLVSNVADADSVAATTLFAYDNVGNVASVNGPRTDVDDASYFTYDLLRRKVFEISPDPDGAGALPRQMVKHVYDADGNEIRTELGTGQSTTGSDFAINRFTRRTFDANGQALKVEEVTP